MSAFSVFASIMGLAISIVASMFIIYKSSVMAMDDSDILEELREIRKLLEQQKVSRDV